jgi:hypothetical protein
MPGVDLFTPRPQYYRDNGPPGVDPQALVGPGSPNADESWKYDFTQDSDYSTRNIPLTVLWGHLATYLAPRRQAGYASSYR